MTEEEAQSMPIWQMVALAGRRAEERRWFSSRIEAVIASMASRKDGSPLKPGDVFPECKE